MGSDLFEHVCLCLCFDGIVDTRCFGVCESNRAWALPYLYLHTMCLCPLAAVKHPQHHAHACPCSRTNTHHTVFHRDRAGRGPAKELQSAGVGGRVGLELIFVQSIKYGGFTRFNPSRPPQFTKDIPSTVFRLRTRPTSKNLRHCLENHSG